MQIHGLLRGVVLGLVPLLAMPATPGAQTTEGRRILANDGDTIVVEGNPPSGSFAGVQGS